MVSCLLDARLVILIARSEQLHLHLDAHIFLSFLAYCLRGTLRQLAGGLTPRAGLEKFATLQMLDLHPPAGKGRELVMARYTQPDNDLKLLLARMSLELPQQPPPEIRHRDQSQS